MRFYMSPTSVASCGFFAAFGMAFIRVLFLSYRVLYGFSWCSTRVQFKGATRV